MSAPSATANGFSLERFECLVHRRQHEASAQALMALLKDLDANYGLTGDAFSARPDSSMSAGDADSQVWVRIASAISCLFADRDFHFSPQGFGQVLTCHRWFASIYGATPFRHADHVIRALSLNGAEDLARLEFAPGDLLKVVVLYSPESEVPLRLDTLWQHHKALAAGLCMALVSARFAGSPAAHRKREQILPWLARRLPEIETLADLPVGVLHDVYMHCSYADRADKHDVKRSINTLIQRYLRQYGPHPPTSMAGPVQPAPTAGPVPPTPTASPVPQALTACPVPSAPGRPTMLVVVEWFTAGHSIYRTHSRSVEAARECFEVVGVGVEDCVDEAGRGVFERFLALRSGTNPLEQLRQIAEIAQAVRAHVLYMPSVGMFPLTMWLANLRVAPLQVMGLGHPATAHASEIDLVAVEDDFVGDPACFSEKLLRLPADSLPYRPFASDVQRWQPAPRQGPAGVVRIAVAATTMKLNPGFLGACARIAQTAATAVHFAFLIGQSQGLVCPQVQRVVRDVLGDRATVYPHQPYGAYMDVIAGADMYINPFPFGNTNGIIDAVSAGLVGVCKTGPEVHEHIDQALFARLGFPDWLVAPTVDAYVAATVRLADGHDERNDLRHRLAGPQGVAKLYVGRAAEFGARVQAALIEKLAG